MYKKITHNIIEEHWDDIKIPEDMVGSWGGSSSDTVTSRRVTATWPITPNQFNYLSALRTQFNQFNSLLRAYATSALSNSPDLNYTKNELMKVADEFATFFDPYFGNSTAMMLSSHLKNFASEFVDFVDSVKSGRDTTSSRTSIIQKLQNFADTMASMNPLWWAPGATSATQYITAYANNIMDQVVFRKASKWAEDIDAHNVATNIIANGPIYQAPFNGSPDFASIVANSIVKQFPTKFV
jgi:hypothetical protein